MSPDPDSRELLRSAFPRHLTPDVDAVLAVLPPARHPPTPPDRPVSIFGEQVTTLGRIYFPEPDHAHLHLTATQATILSCLYTRHHDGFVRVRSLRPLLSVAQPWIPHFVLRLLGEYVVEISEIVAVGAADLPAETYTTFAAENQDYIALTRQRVVSYWACYYRTTNFRDFPGYRAMAILGLWKGREARRVLKG